MIEVAVYNLLKNNAAISAIVGEKVYPMIADEEAQGQYIVFQNISAPRGHTLTSTSSLVKARFQINCWADSYLDAATLKEVVRVALDNYRGIEPESEMDIRCTHFEDEGDLMDLTAGTDESKKYGKRIDIRISYIE